MILRYIFSYQAPPKRSYAKASDKTVRMSRQSLALFCLFISSSLSSFADVIFQSVVDHTINGQKEFAIVVPTYNNSRFCIANIESLITQKYDNYHVYIINDASTDETYEKLTAYIIDHACEDLVTLINNSERVGALANYYRVISSLEDHVIVLNVDGDDWLAHEDVLSTLNNVYDDHNIWLTYGQFKQYPSGEIGFCRSISGDVIEHHNYRKSEWLSTHLRTYYAWLFKKIDSNDLYYNGHFMRACGDRALMYPMLEMCAGHFACIQDVLYIYNCANPLADVRVNLQEQQKMCRYICSLKRYKPLNSILLH